MLYVNKKHLPADLCEAMDYVASTGARIVLDMGSGARVGLVPVEDLDLAQRVEDHLDNQAADAVLAEGGDHIPWEVVKKALDL